MREEPRTWPDKGVKLFIAMPATSPLTDQEKLAQNELDQHRARIIRQHCADLQSANPGLSFASAYNLTRANHPELFSTDEQGRDINQREDRAKAVRTAQEKIRVAVKAKVEADPRKSHTQAWRELQKEKPELFRDLEQVPVHKVLPVSSTYRAGVLRARAHVAAMRAEKSETVVVQGGILFKCLDRRVCGDRSSRALRRFYAREHHSAAEHSETACLGRWAS